MSDSTHLNGDGGGRGLLARLVGDRSMNAKILGLIAVMTIVAAVVGGLSIVRMSDLNTRANEVYEHGLMPVQRINAVALAMMTARTNTLNHGLSTTEAGVARYEKAMQDDDAAFTAAVDTYTTSSSRPGKVAELRAAWAQYQTVRQQQWVPTSRANDFAGLEKVRDEVTGPAFVKADAIVQEILQLEVADGKRRADEATQAYQSARLITLATLILGSALAIVFGLYLARGIVGSLRRVSHVVAGLAAGDLTRTAGLDTRDEIGRMARELDTANERLSDTIGRINGNSHTLAGAAQELSSVNAQIAGNAEQASSRADMVSAAAEQVSRNVETLSAGTEEMTASIREIAGSASDAASVAQSAVSLAQAANATVGKLGESSSEIGNVVKLITSIAEQTNLLALNATIEAARAGEMGKGFAVVANEVKDLAQATSRATEDISSRVSAIQLDAGAAVEAIAQIADVIDRVNGYSATIASAVEEQTATTAEIGRNVSEAAAGAGDIASNITGVATAAQFTSSGVGESRRAAEDLAKMSSELQQLVGQFTVRS